MKRNWRNNVILTALFFLLLASFGCTNRSQHADHNDTYTCPMHPTVVSDKPGSCPVCGMDLVRKARAGEDVKITEDLARLIKSPNETVLSPVRTIKGEFKSMPVSLEAQGIVTYDTRNIYTIPARTGGRLEKVFLKYAFQPVNKGQKVAEIYSPELVTAQRELLYLLESDPGNELMIESAKSKLYLLGATPKQVGDVIRHKDVTLTFPVYSPYDGYVIRDDQPAPAFVTTSSSSMATGMDGSSNAASSPPVSPPMKAQSTELLREGNYVTTGQTLFKIVNATALLIELDLPVSQSGRVKLRDNVDLRLGDQSVVKAKVDFIQPFFTRNEEFVKVRLYIENRGKLQIGQLVDATVRMKPVEALWVPRDAVLNLGTDNIVFVKEREAFRAKNVTAGIHTDGWVEIINGLSSSDMIAYNAQYMVDSESFIKTK